MYMYSVCIGTWWFRSSDSVIYEAGRTVERFVMAAQEVAEPFVFTWKLKNYSFCWQRLDEFLKSPEFYVDIFEGSSWFLKIFPRGVTTRENCVGVNLERSESSEGPLRIYVHYEIAFLRSDGSVELLKNEMACWFRKGRSFGFDDLATREEILQTKASTLLGSNDTLTIRCRIWPNNTTLKTPIHMFAETRIETEKHVFVCETDNISSFSSNLEHIYNYPPNLLKEKTQIHLKLCVQYPTKDKQFTFHVCVLDPTVKVLHCKVALLNSSRTGSEFLHDKYFFESCDKCLEIPINISYVGLLALGNLYIPDDKLILHCDFTASYGVHHSKIEEVIYNNTRKLNLNDSHSETSSIENMHQNNHTCSCVADGPSSLKHDLQSLYQESTLSDVTLKVEEETFKVHKAVLCARSSVFAAMFTNNMRENVSKSVVIEDLEVDTVRRMVIFLYTDTVDELVGETAAKLYFAADKYNITALKQKCSAFLKSALCVGSVTEVLGLSDMHEDEDLKKSALEFIFKCYKEVIASREWISFMQKRPELASETMHLVLKKIAESEN